MRLFDAIILVCEGCDGCGAFVGFAIIIERGSNARGLYIRRVAWRLYVHCESVRVRAEDRGPVTRE